MIDTDTLPELPHVEMEMSPAPATAEAATETAAVIAAPVTVRRADRPSHVPVSLYRVQFHAGFTFDDARALVPYWSALGITDLYASPLLTAGRGSTHGYDISDHQKLNPELGGEEAYVPLAQALAEAQLGLMLDIVPNHMGVDPDRNRWWRDVLENGPSSIYARFFDIDWSPIKPQLTDKVLLPILGDQYGRVLERGELRVELDRGALVVAYGERRLPLDPSRSTLVLKRAADRLREQFGEDDPHLREFLSILSALHNLPASHERNPDKMAERHREKEMTRERLLRLCDAAPAIREQIDEAIRVCNGTPGDPHSFNCLHEMLEAQNYRLANWRTAADEINYRRFFDVNDLAGIHMEDPLVFDATHTVILKLIAEGSVTGLRLDHPDGLYDPLEYVDRLQDRIGKLLVERPGRDDHGASAGEDVSAPLPGQRRPFYVAIEKILSAQEVLPMPWAVYGTTTYSFLNELNGLFVDPGQAQSMRRIYARITGRRESFDTLLYQCKRLIMATSMASEMNVLARELNEISESDRASRDFTLNGLRKALMEVIACFPVYRTYVSERGATDTDRHIVAIAIARARRRNRAMENSIFDFIQRVLIPPGPLDEAPIEERIERARRLSLAMKFQQYTGPVHAKGVEDTAFYRYNVLASLNEVGGDPQRFGRTPGDFHETNRRRLEHWPFEMIGTATHDTKRGEDTRARINVLAELPDEWRRAVGRWMRINASSRKTVDSEHAPDRNDEYLYYQTLIGTWPSERPDAPIPAVAPDDYVTRIQAYMRKAVKEAKTHSSWVNENQAYEQALERFVDATLRGPAARPFLAAFVPLQRRIARLGAINSLAQLALKLTAPGVVDLYQGTELWDLHLVDPDNRQPVDYAQRRAWLDDVLPALPPQFWPRSQAPVQQERAAQAQPSQPDAQSDTARAGLPALVTDLLAHWPDGRIKMLMLAALLRLRREAPDLFLEGEYVPLRGLDDDSARHLVAFARRLGTRVAITIVPRFTSALMPEPNDAQEPGWPLGFDAWKTMHVDLPDYLDATEFRHVLTGATVRPLVSGSERVLVAADVFKTLPIAVLVGDIT
jgi:(1->4)-alpha-D-glucan 1-alpha-D-glucosylmutase